MAASAHVILAYGPLGGNRFQIGHFTAGAGVGSVQTKLRDVKKVEVFANGNADQSMSVYRNATDTTEDATAGAIYVAGAPAAEIRYFVIGR